MSKGYHIREIPKGVLGELSKIEEEYQECLDAIEQGSVIMLLVELSDLQGALDAYYEKLNGVEINVSGLRKYHDLIESQIGQRLVTLEDVKIFSDITKRAFQNGAR